MTIQSSSSVTRQHEGWHIPGTDGGLAAETSLIIKKELFFNGTGKGYQMYLLFPGLS